LLLFGQRRNGYFKEQGAEAKRNEYVHISFVKRRDVILGGKWHQMEAM
jgi:hypothetical protein